ncbi:MAG: peptide ABC transporter substrate-binding protein [Eubacterium sp.]|nr:peptide ABC transporter substrate-binding protein [Eubacterium sp.]
MKKLVAMALCAAMTFSLAACGDSAGSSAGAAEEAASTASASSAASSASAASAAEGEEEEAAPAEIDESLVAADGLNVCIASEPDTIDPALNSSVDGATMIVHLFSGLAKWEQKEDGSYEIVADAAEELPEGVENEDGTVTYTYTLRDGMKWSDGEPVKAGDFEFAWKRAASTELSADYNYMFDQIVGYDQIWESVDTDEVDEEGNPVPEFVNPDTEQLAVKATDDKTLEVTTKQKVPYWNELLAFPTFFPVRQDVVENEAWATDPSTYVCNGPYTMSAWQHNSVITLTKNESYIDADQITMPAINFYLSDDANNMLTNFENGDWKLIDDVPTNEIASLKEQYPDEFVIAGQLGTYYVCWNINEDILPEDSGLEGKEAEEARAEIRNALSLLFDRNYIVNDVAQGGQTPASSFVSSGLTEADGKTDFSEVAGHNEGFAGYYNVSEDALEDNYAQAIEVLKKYYEFDEATQQVKNFPTLTYLYNTSEGHKAIGEYLQSALASVGITMNLENQEWNTFLNTRKAGDYSIARNGWLCDYNDPISMLDMWITASGNNDVQFGKGANANTQAYSLDLTDLGYDTNVTDGTWAETYDVLISDIKSCSDPEVRYELMHRAEDLLMSTGCICPLYYYTDLYMIDDSVEGFFSIPLGYKYFMYTTIK